MLLLVHCPTEKKKLAGVNQGWGLKGGGPILISAVTQSDKSECCLPDQGKQTWGRGQRKRTYYQFVHYGTASSRYATTSFKDIPSHQTFVPHSNKTSYKEFLAVGTLSKMHAQHVTFLIY